MKTSLKVVRAGMALLILTTMGAASNVYSADQLSCKVNDSDIGNIYHGACKNGLAHGRGSAKGRDEYVGQFKNGDPHGIGKYTWGPSSDWAGDVYEGEWRDSEPTGRGKYSSSDGIVYEGQFVNGSLMGFVTRKVPLDAFQKKGMKDSDGGTWKGNYYEQPGLFLSNKFIGRCENKSTCFDVLLAYKIREEEEQKKALDQLSSDIGHTFSNFEKMIEQAAEQEEKKKQRSSSEEFLRRLDQKKLDEKRHKQLCLAQKETCLASCSVSNKSNCGQCYRIRCD